MTAPPFTYWDSVDPADFLQHDWQNPSRKWAAEKAVELVGKDGLLLEVGPGAGIDYERHFRRAKIQYVGVEGSANLCQALRDRYPEAAWRHGLVTALPNKGCDVLYARHVLEHQPTVEPALTAMLRAASVAVVLTWYRPPADDATCEYYPALMGIPCQTFARADVLRCISDEHWCMTHLQRFSDSPDECWVLEPIP